MFEIWQDETQFGPMQLADVGGNLGVAMVPARDTDIGVRFSTRDEAVEFAEKHELKKIRIKEIAPQDR